MKWLKRMIEAGKDRNKFWREWHAERRYKRLVHWRNKREEAVAAVQTADSAIAYYEAQLGIDAAHDQQGDSK